MGLNQTLPRNKTISPVFYREKNVLFPFSFFFDKHKNDRVVNNDAEESPSPQ